jgi:di/tricarboxylate transporter
MARTFTRVAGRSEGRALAILAAIILPLSACVNNTAIVVVFLPVLLAFSRSSGVQASRLLLPLSFLAILGGTITLIGTSTNLLVAGMATDLGQPAFGIFEISKLGVIYAAIGTIYLMSIGRKLLPDRQTLSSLLSSEDTRSFCSQAVIQPGSPMIGKVLSQTPIGRSRTTQVFEIFREGRRVSDTPLDALVFQAGDVLVFKAHARGVAAIQETQGLAFDEDDEAGRGAARRPVKLVEAIIGPNSRFAGHAIRHLGLRRRYGVAAAALHRRGVNLFENFQDIPLAFGDTVIFEGPVENINRLREEDDFLNLNESVQRAFRPQKAPIAIGAVFAVMALAASGLMPIVSAAIVAALVVVITRCIEPREACEAIEWNIIFMIIGMLGLGAAMEKTGAAGVIAERLAHFAAPYGPGAVLSVTYLLATVLTEFITNNAVAILLTPIAIAIAETLGVDARPFIVAIMFGASASFSSPLGYQTNTYVFGAGGYKFSDFPKIGIPLNVILWIAATICIPIFWKFHP